MTKTCPSCKKQSEFSPSKYSTDGMRTVCKTCEAARCRAQRAKKRATFTPDEIDITVDEEVLRDYAAASLPPLANAYAEVQKAKDKRDIKKEHGALVEENTRLKREIEEIARFRSAPSVIVYKQPKWERADAVANAIASDWHIEEPVEKAAVHGLNEYNLEIATSRAKFFFQNVLRLTDIMARDSKITTIHLAALGDFFTGYLHDDNVIGNLLAPGDAAQFCKGLWFSGVDFLLRESSYILEGNFIPGNHGRMTKKMSFSDPTGTSLETLMYHGIADRYHNNPRVQFKVSTQAMVYRKVFEKFVVRSIHGYEVKYGGGIGGLTVPLRKALASWNNPIRADLTEFGHFHQFFDGGDFIGNGSLIGFNLFAQGIKASFEEPRQAFYLIHARNGGTKSVTAPVWLDEAQPQVTL